MPHQMDSTQVLTSHSTSLSFPMMPNGNPRGVVSPSSSPETASSSYTGVSQGSNQGFNGERHSYSCKRCRRLKKKCSRTKPECHNCAKAGESCEYVPRAPRRKKSEILKSLAANAEHEAATAAAAAARAQSQAQVQQQTAIGLPALVTNDEKLQRNGIYRYDQGFDSQRQQQLQQQKQQSQPPLGQNLPQHSALPFIARESTLPLPQPLPGQYADSQSQRLFKLGAKPSLPPIRSLTGYQPAFFQQAPTPHPPQLSQVPPPQQQKQPQPQPQAQPQHQQESQQYQQQAFQQHAQAQVTSQAPYRSPPQASQPHARSEKSISPMTPNELHQAYLSKVINIATDSQARDFSLSQRYASVNLSAEVLDKSLKTFFEVFARNYPCFDNTKFKQRHSPLSEKFHKAMSEDDSDGFELIMAILLGYTSLTLNGDIAPDAELSDTIRLKVQSTIENIKQFETLDSVYKILLFGLLALLDKDPQVSWYLDGVLTRLALSLGLDNSLQESSGESEWRNRLFWSIYTYDRTVAGALGRPFALDDDNVDVAFPEAQISDDKESVELTTALVKLRAIEGRIIKHVHCVNACKVYKTEEEKLNVIKTLRMEIESWYNTTSLLAYSDKKLISNPAATAWYYSAYYHLLLLLYKPSFLMSDLNKDTLQLLGKTAGQYITYLYNLHAAFPLPMTWPMISKLVSHCSTMVYCICSSAVDFSEIKMELKLCTEILSHYTTAAPITTELINLFNRIATAICESQTNVDDPLKEPEQCRTFLSGIGIEYLGIVKRFSSGANYDKPLLNAIESIVKS